VGDMGDTPCDKWTRGKILSIARGMVGRGIDPEDIAGDVYVWVLEHPSRVLGFIDIRGAILREIMRVRTRLKMEHGGGDPVKVIPPLEEGYMMEKDEVLSVLSLVPIGTRRVLLDVYLSDKTLPRVAFDRGVTVQALRLQVKRALLEARKVIVVDENG